MQRRLYNIETSVSPTTTTLIPVGGSNGSIASIRLTNSSAAAVDVDLHLYEERPASVNDKAYIAVTNIPSKTTLLLNEGISFDNSVLGLKIITTNGSSLSASTPLSVIIK
jgi:hypothetical protein